VPLDQVVPGLIRCVDRVPGDVPVGLHLCYGDYGHQHFKQPESLGMHEAYGRRSLPQMQALVTRRITSVGSTIDGSGTSSQSYGGLSSSTEVHAGANAVQETRSLAN